MHTSDSVLLPRFVLTRAAAAGLDPARLARDAGMPSWLLTDSDARVPSDYFPRLWELLEYQLDDPEFTLRSTGSYRLGEFGLIDYLVSTAETVGAGLGVLGPYVGSVSTNFRIEPGAQTETESTFDVYTVNNEGRGRDLSVQMALATLVWRMRQTTGRPMDPVRVQFREPAPRRLDAFTEQFGTARLDFGAPIDRITYRSADFELPQITADPLLAAVLRRHAATMPPPPPRATEWPDRVAAVLAEVLDSTDAMLDHVARRLYTSPRTLQRRLAESGTTWRLEVDRARKRHLELLEIHWAADHDDEPT
ncbi:AraC family transcriptional regulator ligand-binding domain-containing protein [Nocardia niigatensis]|uniref:AraC family transcriptional regulator ligand-binding domain-containing protein n=1 Tax=Nocardia niigatensis TaxID=209249 RepID=UPI0012F625E2|nr:AraC family transcriptional regulator ligand-binding domain-containing protein [Nocardia niigatensis]